MRSLLQRTRCFVSTVAIQVGGGYWLWFSESFELFNCLCVSDFFRQEIPSSDGLRLEGTEELVWSCLDWSDLVISLVISPDIFYSGDQFTECFRGKTFHYFEQKNKGILSSQVKLTSLFHITTYHVNHPSWAPWWLWQHWAKHSRVLYIVLLLCCTKLCNQIRARVE